MKIAVWALAGMLGSLAVVTVSVIGLTWFFHDQASEPAEIPQWSAPVDCLGNGSACSGTLVGSEAKVRVESNSTMRWQLKATCAYGGDQLSEIEQPWPNAVMFAYVSCKFGSPATYWNVVPA